MANTNKYSRTFVWPHLPGRRNSCALVSVNLSGRQVCTTVFQSSPALFKCSPPLLEQGAQSSLRKLFGRLHCQRLHVFLRLRIYYSSGTSASTVDLRHAVDVIGLFDQMILVSHTPQQLTIVWRTNVDLTSETPFILLNPCCTHVRLTICQAGWYDSCSRL